MRLATITNWAYGATVVLTLASATTMLLASLAFDRERAAVEQRYALDKASSAIGTEVFSATDHARQFLNTGDPSYRILYGRDVAGLRAVEGRIARMRDVGASSQELDALRQVIRWAETLHDEQVAALNAYAAGDERQARRLLFGAEYERELDRTRNLIERFQDRIDRRTEVELATARSVAQLWKRVSEAVLAITGLLFLGVLSFVFKRRVLRPVVRLSDVVSRLAAQDYAVEPPDYDQIDEIGDMAQAIRVFRENGLERQRLEEERKTDIALRDLLSRMTQRMQGSDSLCDLKDVVCRFIPAIAPSLAGSLYTFDDARNEVVEACSWLEPKHSRREFVSADCWALRRGLPHRPDGEVVDVGCKHVDSSAGQTLCLPLTAQGETLGLLYFEPRQNAEESAKTPDIYMRMLAENVGLALANLKLRDALEDMAMADGLTSLANRRRLDAVLEREVAEAERENKPISCLMVDVDHFKHFNDSHGHDAGDSVLREVGATLKATTRDDGLAFRFGGEEFLVLLPGVDAEQARARAEEIRARIAAIRLMHDGRDIGQVTVSVGVASAPLHCSASRLAQVADAALLQAKALGRNRVQIANSASHRKVA